ncbi:nucleoside recognition domain-containing protein [Balneolales bacterium ANBcel1]|nr:nucleoside recognition domain-containing protein [Balneolales bacterium ANBcel1]
MLNYIWSGLIIISLLFAVTQDASDLIQDTYRNGEIHNVEIVFPENGDPGKRQSVRFSIPDHEGTFEAVWRPLDAENRELVITVSDGMPEHWQRVAENQEASTETEMLAQVTRFERETGRAAIVLPEVRYVKLRAITAAAFNMAEFAVTLAIGLIGVMALWLGLMKIAEKSGLVYILVRLVQPFLRFLFPNVPKSHPAHGIISLNMAANMLGLGNAATPLGIKAMEELQKINPSKDRASNAQCMLLTVNTASVQLLPPATLVALIGTGVNQLVISMALATLISLIVGITAAKIYERFHPEEPHLENIPVEQKSEA